MNRRFGLLPFITTAAMLLAGTAVGAAVPPAPAPDPAVDVPEVHLNRKMRRRVDAQLRSRKVAGRKRC